MDHIRFRIEIEEPGKGMAFVKGIIDQGQLDFCPTNRREGFLSGELWVWERACIREFLIRTGRGK